MHPVPLASIFEYSELHGFQDIWFEGLNPDEVEDLFLFAYRFGGMPAPKSVERCRPPTESDLNLGRDSQLQDTCLDLDHFVFEGIEISDVCVRIEDDALAIDFQAGLEYWTHERIQAFVHWVRLLCSRAPKAELTWAAEGNRRSPCQRTSLILREAVKRDA